MDAADYVISPLIEPRVEEGSKDRTMVLNMGPQHPSTHGVLRLVLEIDGETVLRLVPDIGFLHTGIEKTCEAKFYQQVVPLTDRIDYLSPMSNNLCYCLAVEKLLQLEIPPRAQFLRVLADRRLLIFCACAMLFTFANAPMLMLISGIMTAKVGNPSLLVAACIVLPQIIVALASPSVGRLAEQRGRRIVLIIGFCMLPLRGLLFATSSNPTLVVAVQALDGIGGACFGIMVPLIVSDVAGRSGHFNLSLGFVGFAIGIGATVSTPAAGWLADHFGVRPAFFFLAAVGIAAVLLVSLAMPETRPKRDADDGTDA